MGSVFDTPLEKVIERRRSVRTYENRPLSPEIRSQLNHYIATLSNPFSAEVTFALLDANKAENKTRLGTYGMIRGASEYIGSTVRQSEYDLEGLGYAFEKLILYAASIGLGTCWLGGTFKRSAFAEAFAVREGVLFPAITPVGWETAPRMAEKMMRRTVRADNRLPWELIFFKNDFRAPLDSAGSNAGGYAFPLEMVRLGPSASNKQPWRAVLREGSVHFYEYKTPGYSDRFSYDIQRIDMGIAACHFHLTAIEKGIPGGIAVQDPGIQTPENTRYSFSWLP